MIQYSAEQFRQRLAGLEAPEHKFAIADIEMMKGDGVLLIKALRQVFGSSLDRMTLWQRISDGIPVSAAKSRGKVDKFIASMLDYIKAEANHVVGSEALGGVFSTLCLYSPEGQRQFIRTCVEYRMLLCLQARDGVETERKNTASIKEQTGASEVKILPDGSIMTKGES